MKAIKYSLFFAALVVAHTSVAQFIMNTGLYRATVEREDGIKVPFQFDWQIPNKLPRLHLVNGIERMQTGEVSRIINDSIFVEMPFFESRFALKLVKTDSLSGYWYFRNSKGWQSWKMTAVHSKIRFSGPGITPTVNLTGRWNMSITRPNGTLRPALFELQQKGSKITGSVLTPSGDYRYLDGVVKGNQLQMSVFDGSHAFLITATYDHATKSLVNGKLFTGFNAIETWTGTNDPKAELPDVGNVPTMLPGQRKLNFAFPDLDSVPVSIHDSRFKNKVVVVQILGSWCPNCMDETAFLSNFYNNQKNKDVEVVGLAYEYSEDFYRGQRTLKKFKERFRVNYPILITGVGVNDSQRTEKTLPQLSPIKVFPTTIFIGKDGTVRKIHASFYGPGTGQHHEAFKKEFFEILDALKAE